MARELKTIYAEIIAAKEADTNLSDLNTVAGETMSDFVAEISTSKVSIWRLWCYIVAFYVWVEEKKNDIFNTEIEQFAATKQRSTLRSIQEDILNYLHGKPLIWNATLGKFYQELLDTDDETTLKIIKYCAVTKSPTQLRIKVAKDNSGVPGIITTPEATALSSFISQIVLEKFELVNNSADELNVVLDVYVDPLVINVSTGELHLEPGVKPAEDAAKAYLLSLDFNGRFTNTYFIDEIQAAHGVTNIEPLIIEHKFALLSYAPIEVSVIADSGYFKFANLTINYKAAEV